MFSFYVLGYFILTDFYTFVIPGSEFSKSESANGNYLRFIFQGHVFYTSKYSFKNHEQFDRLSKKGKLYLYAHQLDDGSYWIHWIVDENNLILEPLYASQNLRPNIIISAVSTLVILISVLLFILFYHDSAFACTLTLVVGIFAFITLHLNITDVIAFYSKLNKASLKYLQQVKEKDFTFFTPPPSRIVTPASGPVSSEIPISLKDSDMKTEGVVNALTEISWTARKGEADINYNAFLFHCNGSPLIMCWQRDGSLAENPAFVTCPPPFIAVGDRIICVYERKERTRILACKLPESAHKVIALINLTDRSQYYAKGVVVPGVRSSEVTRFV